MNATNKTNAERDNELCTLRKQLAELEEQLRDAAAMRARHEQTEHALGERMKELNCLYRIAEAVDRCADSVERLLQEIVNGLPDSWQYPDTTCARIVFGECEYTTAGFQRSPWQQSMEFHVSGKQAGVVEVYYLSEMPILDEGPFLKEERLLINAVAERTGKIIERINAKQQLKVERSALEQSNVAMRELMARIQEEKAEIGKAIQSNVAKIIMPIVDAVEIAASPQQKGYLSLLRHNLEDIVSPFIDQLARAFTSLTPAEIRVCDRIRRGLSTKEIARLQTISTTTVRHHREHIRHKLGLTNKNVNLMTYLNAFPSDSNVR